MKILSMKSVFFFLLITSTLSGFSQTKKEKEVAAIVEKFRVALVDADRTALENLVSDQLSYGHSPGYVEDKKTFIGNLMNGKSDFVTMTLSNQTISISDKVAVVRNKLDAVTNDNGKPGEAHILVLMIWHKKGGQWKLLARQAVKQAVAVK